MAFEVRPKHVNTTVQKVCFAYHIALHYNECYSYRYHRRSLSATFTQA